MGISDNYSKEEKEQIMNQIHSALGETKVPKAVLERAIYDPLYLHHLLLVKDSPSFLKKLIHEVVKESSDTTGKQVISHGYNEVNSLDAYVNIRQPKLKEITNATRAILSALAVPSLRTSDIELEIRLDACSSCKNRVAAPNKGIYKLSKIAMGNDICQLCGCHIETKARLAKERCPAPDENNPGFNRWGQSIQ